jgi:hypothetical protein
MAQMGSSTPVAPADGAADRAATHNRARGAASRLALPLRMVEKRLDEACDALAAALAAVAGRLPTATDMLKGRRSTTSRGASADAGNPARLTTPARDNRYVLPDTGKSSATFSGYQSDRAQQARPRAAVRSAAGRMDKMRVERAGSQRWLVVAEPPEKLWPLVRDFWQENGFLIRRQRSRSGRDGDRLAENRAKIPQDWIRNMLGKLIDQIYSTAEARQVPHAPGAQRRWRQRNLHQPPRNDRGIRWPEAGEHRLAAARGPIRNWKRSSCAG